MEELHIVLEDGVPIPSDTRKDKYPELSYMLVGDSFIFSSDFLTRLRAACVYRTMVYGKEYKIRREGSHYRCWRVR